MPNPSSKANPFGHRRCGLHCACVELAMRGSPITAEPPAQGNEAKAGQHSQESSTLAERLGSLPGMASLGEQLQFFNKGHS